MKTVQFQGLRIRIDRPKGFVQEGKDQQGKPWKRIYKYDYGFLPKTKGGDGDGVDVFVGPDESIREAYWVIQRKDDGSFDEYKVFVGFKSKADAKKAYGEHIPMRYFGGMVAMPIEMMKAMLGIEPLEKAAFLGFIDEVGAIGGSP
jgi:Inorganic Pyrophosphatase